MDNVMDWLSSRGEERRQAVTTAASHLLRNYQVHERSVQPTNLDALAGHLNCRIVEIKGLKSGARLLPCQGGFLVLVSDSLPNAKYRTSVAHELAHTLFYAFSDEVPTRLTKLSRDEEHFCFDVGRQLLAPYWLMDPLGVKKCSDSAAIFECLINKLCLSKPIAARIMLEDYLLVRGVAAFWGKHNDQWFLQRGYCYAHPELNLSERKLLHKTARRWLEEKTQLPTCRRVTGYKNNPGNRAFVIVDFPDTDISLNTNVALARSSEQSSIQLKFAF